MLTSCVALPKGFDVDPIIEDIKDAVERERVAENAIGWNIIFFPTPAIRRMMLVGVLTAVAQQAVGIDAIQYYLIDVLEESGIESEKGRLGILVLLGLLKLIFIIIGGKMFDRRGRRPLFFASLIGTCRKIRKYNVNGGSTILTPNVLFCMQE
jgi:MFS family permease